MLLYAQRIEVLSRLIDMDELVKSCREWDVVCEKFESFLKIWLVLEYIQNSDFWRRRLYTNDGKQINDRLITTYAPAYVYFPPSTEENKTLVDIIALDKRSFDGAIELIQQKVEKEGGTINPKRQSIDKFPENVPVEGFYTVDYNEETEQTMGFNAPRSRTVLKPPTETYRYFSITIGTDHPVVDGIRLTTIGLEVQEGSFALNLVKQNFIDEPLNSGNQEQFIEGVLKLLDSLYNSPAEVCTSTV